MQYLLGRRRGSSDSVSSTGSGDGGESIESAGFVAAAIHPGLEYISNLSSLNRTLLLLDPPGKSGSLSVGGGGGGSGRSTTIDAATVSRACAPHIRVAAIKQLPETCYNVGYDDATEYILPLVLARLPTDPDPSVRQALLDTLGELAAFLILSDPEEGYATVVNNLFPLVTNILVNDKSNEVRAHAASAMATLAAHMRARDHGETVLSTLLRLSQTPADFTASGTLGDDERESSGNSFGTVATAAVQLMGQLSPTLGPDICSQYIVAQLNSLTEERSPKIRRTVAAAMAEVAAVVGPSLTLSKLYPFYVQLTHDSHWAVRKSAIDSMHLFLIELVKGDDERNASPRDSAVSELLSAMAAALVTDTSWWVRKSAMLKVGYVIASCGPCTSHSSIFNSVEPLLVQFADFILSHASNLSQMSSRESSRSSKGTYNNNTSGESLGGAELSREVLYHCSFTFAGVARSAFSSGVEFGPIWSQRLQKPFLSLLHCSESKVRRPLIASVHVLVSTCGKHCEEVFEDCALAVVQILASPQALTEERILVLRNAVEDVFRRLGPGSVLRSRILRILTMLASSQSATTSRVSRSASLSSLSSRGDDDNGNITVTDTTGWREKRELARVAGKLFSLLDEDEVEASEDSPINEGSIGSLVALWLVLLSATTPTISLAAASSAPQLFRCRRVGPEMKHRIVAYLVKTYACSECYSRRRVLVEVAKEVLLSSRSGGVRDEGSLRSEARYFLTLLALLGLDDCVHIRLAVVSTLHLLNPLPAHPPESIETLIETLRQDDDREVRTVAKSILISTPRRSSSFDWGTDTEYEDLPSPSTGDYSVHWVLYGDDIGTALSPSSSSTRPVPPCSSSCSSLSGVDGGTGSSDGAGHTLLEEVDEELAEALAARQKTTTTVDTIRHDTPRSTPGQASPSISRSFYIGGEDAEDERVDDAVDFPLEDYRQMNDDITRLPLAPETLTIQNDSIEDVFDQTDWTTATLSPKSRGVSFDEG